MVKDDKLLTELIEKVTTIEDKLTNMEFLFVQGMGSGGGNITTANVAATIASQKTGTIEVDLMPLEGRIVQLENSINNISNQINNLNKVISDLASEKSKKADELIAQATNLLEKGLQMTELETTLLEFKDRIEEIIVQLEVANIGSSSEDNLS